MPQFIAEHDEGGSDAYAALRRLVRYNPVGPEVAAFTPLFRDFSESGGGKHFTVSTMRELVRERMRALGFTAVLDWWSYGSGGNRQGVPPAASSQRAVGE